MGKKVKIRIQRKKQSESHRSLWFLGLILSLGTLTVFLLSGFQQTAAAAGVDKSNWPKRVTYAGSAQGGTQYLWGAAAAKVLNEKLGVSLNVEVTTGPSANVQLINRKESEFGAANVPVVWEGYNGIAWAKGNAQTNVRSMVPQYPAYLHWFALAKSGLKTIRDFNGKIVNHSGATSSPALYGGRLFEFLGIKPARITNLASYDDTQTQLKDDRIDAAATWSGVPHPAVIEMALTTELSYIGIPKEDAERFVKQYPYFGVGTVPSGTYKGQKEEMTVLSQWSVMVTHKDIPENMVYEMTKAIMENRDLLVMGYKGASDTKLENVQWITTPLHKGSLRYYREKGVKISDLAVPPEAK